MTTFLATPTRAHANVTKSLIFVDGLLSYMSDGKGKPEQRQRALYAAAVVFTYGIWENYVEQLAIELATHLSATIKPERVPERIRKTFEKGSVWEVAVSPEWRYLWLQKVKLQAVGDEDSTYGMNTAKAAQVKALLELSGVDDPFVGITGIAIPKHLGSTIVDPSEAINQLVALRGQIVHTGSVPKTLRNDHVHSWRQFVEDVAREVDTNSRNQCAVLLK